MPAKTIKLHSGTKIAVKAVRLANGNLLIPSRASHDRTVSSWREVAPGSSDFKRWSTVAVDEPDPRTT